jgi:hypothetical protein
MSGVPIVDEVLADLAAEGDELDRLVSGLDAELRIATPWPVPAAREFVCPVLRDLARGRAGGRYWDGRVARYDTTTLGAGYYITTIKRKRGIEG